MPILTSTIRRFESKFSKGAPEECWEWKAYCHPRAGYGQFRNSESGQAHRFSYRLYVGPIPDGLMVLHRCDNPPCVNPNHLFVGTGKDNMQDKIRKGRRGPNSPGPGDKACKGEEHGMRKLTKEEVIQIRKRYKRTTYHNTNARQLAAEFGVNQNQITRIVKGHRWKHLKENAI